MDRQTVTGCSTRHLFTILRWVLEEIAARGGLDMGPNWHGQPENVPPSSVSSAPPTQDVVASPGTPPLSQIFPAQR